jgi:hypothetical protein
VDVELLESTTELNEVIVEAKKDASSPNNEMAVVSTRSFHWNNQNGLPLV